MNELSEMMVAEEKRLAAQVKAVADMKKAMFKKNQDLFSLRNTERDLIAEIAGGQAQNKNLISNISKLDSQVSSADGPGGEVASTDPRLRSASLTLDV